MEDMIEMYDVTKATACQSMQQNKAIVKELEEYSKWRCGELLSYIEDELMGPLRHFSMEPLEHSRRRNMNREMRHYEKRETFT